MADIEYKEGFTAVGSARELAIMPMSDEVQAPNQVFTVQFGHLQAKAKEDGTAGAVSGKWALSRAIVKDGEEVMHTVYSGDCAKLVETQIAVVYGAFGIADQVVADADFEEEYFGQKFVAVTDDVWQMPQYAEQLDAFAEARGKLEEVLEHAQESGVAAQDENRKVAEMLCGLRDQVGGNMKLLLSIVKGTGEGSGNMPLVAKLGKGVNALKEAMALYETVSESEYELMPVSVTSGKGVQHFRSKALASVAEDAYSSKDPRIEFDHMEVGDTTVFLPTMASAAAILRVMAKRFFAVEALDMSDGEYVLDLDEVATLVDERALKLGSECRMMYGKHANTYDKEEYSTVLRGYGALMCSSAGTDNLFAQAVEGVVAAAGSDDYAAKINSLAGTRGNLLFRHAVNVCRAAIESNAKTAAIKETLDEVGDVDSVSATGFAGLEPLAAAAHLYKIMNTHPKAGDAWAELRGLCANVAPANKEPVPAA